MDVGAPELIIVLVIIIILFGPGRLANIGGEMGKAIRNFREGLQSAEAPKPEENKPADEVPAADPTKNLP